MTSPSKLFRNCSNLLWSLVILILNRCTLYFAISLLADSKSTCDLLGHYTNTTQPQLGYNGLDGVLCCSR